MGRSRFSRPVAVLLILLAAAWRPGAALAQPTEAAAVNPGDSTVIARQAKKFKNVVPTVGAAVPVDPGGPAGPYALVYFPPAGVTNADAQVTYELEGTPGTTTVLVHIQSLAPTLSGDLYTKSFKALFILFVLAVLVENGLDLLFRWRPFVSVFDTRSVNPIVSFVFAFFFVELFQLDIVTGLLNIYSGTTAAPGLPGSILTAMIIAGGSAGVNRIFRALGFRPASNDPDQATAKPPPDHAWVSVRLAPKSQATGRLNVLVGPPEALAMAGTIEAGPSAGNGLAALFLRSRTRFPPSGGHLVTPGTRCMLTLSGMRADGTLLTASWGPFTPAPGAIIDTVLDPRPVAPVANPLPAG